MMLQIKFDRIWHGLREGIGELKYRPQKSTFNASDRELLSRTPVTGGIEKSCLGHSSLFSNALSHTKTKHVVDKKFPLLMMTGNFCL